MGLLEGRFSIKMAGAITTAGKKAGQVATRQVKPLLSLDADEARVRVLSLYRAWYRQIPSMVQKFDLPVNEDQLKAKLKEEFIKNAHLKDVRVIDMKVIQGQQDLREIAEHWQEHVIFLSKYFGNLRIPERPKDFMSKFIHGHE